MHDFDILIIENDREAAERMARLLEENGSRVSIVGTGEQGLREAARTKWRLIVLDLTLPDMAGFDVCRDLKRSPFSRDIPLVIVSKRKDEADIVAALELGADDYLIKPVGPRVFISKLRALLRQIPRTARNRTEAIEIQGIAIHPGRHEVRIGEKRIGLTVTEFDLLHLLARYPGHVVRRQEILAKLRGKDAPSSERAVDVQIAGLRRRLGAYGNRIETVRGVGYRLRVH